MKTYRLWGLTPRILLPKRWKQKDPQKRVKFLPDYTFPTDSNFHTNVCSYLHFPFSVVTTCKKDIDGTIPYNIKMKFKYGGECQLDSSDLGESLVAGFVKIFVHLRVYKILLKSLTSERQSVPQNYPAPST